MNEIDLKITNNQHFSKPQEINSQFSPEKKEKLAKAAKDFESLLTSMMMKSMTQTTSGMFGGEEAFGGDILDTMFESEVSQYLTESRGLGVAEMIYKKVTGEDFPNELIHKLKINPPKINTINHDSTETIVPSRQSLERLNRYEEIISKASEFYGVDKEIIKSVILAESSANDKALSKANAKGLMQLIDSTAKDMGVSNVWDPVQNIHGGTKYLSQLLRQYNGDLKLALAGYNAGPLNVKKYGGVPPFEETQAYVVRVMGYLNYLEN
jgi:Rod binding domain-containing protein